MDHILDSIHLALRRSYWMSRFVMATRMLLAAGFIPTGLVKIMGERFTKIPSSDPIGAFFEALYQTGGYWQFLGWTQVFAGVFVLIPRFACLGACVFFGIILNIFVITVALGFNGTPFITGLMLLATLLLLAWDFHQWRRLVFRGLATEPPPLPPLRWHQWERALIAIGFLGGMTFFLGTRSFATAPMAAGGLFLAGLCAVALGGLWLAQEVARRRHKIRYG